MRKTVKAISLIVVLVLCVTLSGCNKKKPGDTSSVISGISSSTDSSVISEASTSSDSESSGSTSSNSGKNTGKTSSTTSSNGTSLGNSDDGLPKLQKPSVPAGTIKLACVNVESEVGLCNKLISGFKKEYPNITVNLEKISGEYDNKIITQSASGQIADVISVFDYMLRTYASSKVLDPLDALYSSYGLDEKYYIKSVMDISKGDDGKLYMAPREYSHIVVAVNKTILQSENIPMPGNNWTYNDFLNICKKVTKKDASGKVTQFGVGGGNSSENIWGAYALGFGGTLIDGSGKLTLSNANSINGLNAMFSMIIDGYSVNDYKDTENQGGFLAGTSAFFFCSRPGFDNINSSFAKLGMEWDVLPMFSMPNARKVGFGTVGYGVTAKSKNKSQATAFVNYVLSVEGQTTLYKTGATIPVIKALQAQGAWRSLPVAGKNSEAFIYKPEDDITTPLHRVLDSKKYLDFRTEFQQLQLKIIAKEITVADAMKSIDAKING